jgi:hypothetical protein
MEPDHSCIGNRTNKHLVVCIATPPANSASFLLLLGCAPLAEPRPLRRRGRLLLLQPQVRPLQSLQRALPDGVGDTPTCKTFVYEGSSALNPNEEQGHVEMLLKTDPSFSRHLLVYAGKFTTGLHALHYNIIHVHTQPCTCRLGLCRRITECA